MSIRAWSLLALMVMASLLGIFFTPPPTIAEPDRLYVGETVNVDRPGCTKTVCGSSYIELSCHPERDGPVLYVKMPEKTRVMACGGACMTGQGPPGSKKCEACPPPEWNGCISSLVRVAK